MHSSQPISSDSLDSPTKSTAKPEATFQTVGDIPAFLNASLKKTQSQKPEPIGEVAGDNSFFERLRWIWHQLADRKFRVGMLVRISLSIIGFTWIGLGWLWMKEGADQLSSTPFTGEAINNGLDTAHYAISELNHSPTQQEKNTKETSEQSINSANSNGSLDTQVEAEKINMNPIVHEKIVVNVSGAVAMSGVYSVEVGSRVGDALAAAGGLTKQADAKYVQQQINLAEKLQDEQKIYIPTLADTQEWALASQPVTSQLSQASFTSPRPSSPAQAGAGSADTGASAKISINSSTQAELDSLPGIGQARATSIIEGRPYSTLEELVNKKVISASLFADIEDLIRL